MPPHVLRVRIVRKIRVTLPEEQLLRYFRSIGYDMTVVRGAMDQLWYRNEFAKAVRLMEANL